MPLPDTLSRYIEQDWSAVIPNGATLVIERSDGSIEVYSKGRNFAWENGEGVAKSAADFDMSKIRRLEKALELVKR